MYKCHERRQLRFVRTNQFEDLVTRTTDALLTWFNIVFTYFKQFYFNVKYYNSLACCGELATLAM